MPGDIRLGYGPGGQTVSISLASLAAGAHVISSEITNASNKFADILVVVKVRVTSAAPGFITVYAIGSVDSGVTYQDSSSIEIPNYRRLGTIRTANSTVFTHVGGPFSVAQAFGSVPERIKIVVHNQHGGALTGVAGDHAVLYQGVYGSYT
jgi:hypothetical protein